MLLNYFHSSLNELYLIKALLKVEQLQAHIPKSLDLGYTSLNSVSEYSLFEKSIHSGVSRLLSSS